MRWLLDVIYAVAAIVLLPIWLPRMAATGKIRTDWAGRFGRVYLSHGGPDRPTILIHAVSVGEVNATQTLVELLERDARRPRLVISTTTDTGFARARALFAEKHEVVRYPLDLSVAVGRFLRAVRPDVVALMELEVWPNFTAACARRGIAVCVINGRLSERSARRYRKVRWFMRPPFRRLSFAAAQTADYAARFLAMGTPREHIHVTDTMKWDTARIEDEVAGADALAAEMGINRTKPLIVAGSTAKGEHEILLQAVPQGAQLLCAPRKPEWFDDAAAVLEGCARRSTGQRGSERGLFLLDTIGELRKAYALADLAVVGRTLLDFGGSDMMEPIGLGRATIIGPHVGNFQDTAQLLRDGGGLVQCDVADLPATIRSLLDDPDRRRELAERGREIIRSHQGASARHAKMILELLDQARPRSIGPALTSPASANRHAGP
jgi:3-deoxy-D-manno-octulosonic-acid transferase